MNGAVFQRGGTLETDLWVATGLVTETEDENRDKLVGEITPDIELIVGYVKICCKSENRWQQWYKCDRTYVYFRK